MTADTFTRNVKFIQSRRHTPVPEADIFKVHLKINAHGGEAPLGGIVEILGGGALGSARAAALMCRRELDINLERPLSTSSRVRAIARASN